MKKVVWVLVLAILLLQSKGYSQSSNLENNNGLRSFVKYFQTNIHYPEIDREFNLQGKVIVQFRLTKKQTLENLQVLRTIAPECDTEVLRKIDKYNVREQRFNLKLVPGNYRILFDFALLDQDYPGAQYDGLYDAQQRIIKIPIVTSSPPIKTVVNDF